MSLYYHLSRLERLLGNLIVITFLGTCLLLGAKLVCPQLRSDYYIIFYIGGYALWKMLKGGLS